MVSYVLCSHINTVKMMLGKLLHAPTIAPISKHMCIVCLVCLCSERPFGLEYRYMDCGKVCVRWCVYLSKWVAELVDIKVFGTN